MPAGRFVVSATALAEGAKIELDAATAHQVRDVLRLAVGDSVTLLDGLGGEWTATLSAVGRTLVAARIQAHQPSTAEPRARLTLYQGMLKGAKLEWVLQKGTELGVAAFIPVLNERAVAGSDELGGAKRARWQRILVEATEQCGRARVPELGAPRSLAQALAELPASGIALIPWEEERRLSLREALLEQLAARASAGIPAGPPANARASTADPASPSIALFIGPEGGFSAAELVLARALGAVAVTLGPRILRAETAALVAIALVMEACGELG